MNESTLESEREREGEREKERESEVTVMESFPFLNSCFDWVMQLLFSHIDVVRPRRALLAPTPFTGGTSATDANVQLQ